MRPVSLFSCREAVSDYLLHIESGLSRHTYLRAKWALPYLLDWCDLHGIEALATLTRRALLEWSLAMRAGTLSAQSVWTVMKTVKAFLRWCEQEELIERYPLKAHDFPPQPRPQPKPLSVAEAHTLLQAVEGSGWLARRNQALLRVLLHTGLRRGEVLQMRVRDVDTPAFTVLQKGGQPHVVYLNAPCVAAIRAYLRALKRQTGVALAAEDALWRSQRQTPLTANGVRLLFNRLTKRLGDRVWCHRMRATSATLRLAAGASTEVVRATLGHADHRSLQAYVKLAQSDMAQLVDETSPLKALPKR